MKDDRKCGLKNAAECVPNPIEIAKDKIGDAAGDLAGSAIEQFATAVAESVGEAVKALMTFWVKVPTPQIGTAGWVQERLYWWMTAVAVLAVIIAGGRMAWSGRGEPARDLVRALVTLVLVSAAGITAVWTLLRAGDSYSLWILETVGGKNFGERLLAMFPVLSPNGPATGLILTILLGLCVILSSLAQIVLLVIRSAALVLVTGFWPLSAAAAATNTDLGRAWFNRLTGWIFALLLYKPVAATIYAAGIKAFGEEDSLLGALMGLAIIVLSLVALPALMKVSVPAVSAMGGAAGPMGGAAAGVAAVGMVAAPSGSSASGSGPSGAISASGLISSAPSGGRAGATGAAGVGSPGPQGGAGSPGAPGRASGAASTGAAGKAAGAAGTAAGPAGAVAGTAVDVAKGAKSAASNAVTQEDGPRGAK